MDVGAWPSLSPQRKTLTLKGMNPKREDFSQPALQKGTSKELSPKKQTTHDFKSKSEFSPLFVDTTYSNKKINQLSPLTG